MLLYLEIANLALVERVRLSFGPGLNVISGETGAGKSLIMEALALVSGGRQTGDIVRTGATEANIEAVFTAGEREILISREIGRGRSLFRLDGRPSTAALVRESLTDLLDLVGQGETLSLARPEWQRETLDAYGSLGGMVAEVGRLGREMRELAEAGREDDPRQLDYLRFQWTELQRADLRPGEDDELAQERRIWAERSRLEEALSAVSEALGGQGGAETGVALAVRQLERVAALDASLAETVEGLRQAGILLSEVRWEVERRQSRLEENPGRLEEIEDRLAFLGDLKRKHSLELAGLLKRREELAAAITAGEERVVGAAERRAELTRCRTEQEAALSALSAGRRQAGMALAAALNRELVEVGLGGGRVEITLSELAEPGSHGRERVEFNFQANPGEGLKPLARVASGGEMSRLMLALRSVTAGAAGLGTIVFDEVDQGIGGRTAEVVARRLYDLSRSVQVIAVTHLPVLAARADHHLVIRKVEKDGRRVTEAAAVAGAERRAEIARMIGGDPATAAQHAERLLQGGAEAGTPAG